MLPIGLTLLIGLTFFFSACQNQYYSAAPLGERQTLEKLAQSYNDIATQLPTAPSGLNPKGKLKFVTSVFEKNGFSYTLTAQQLVAVPDSEITQYHKDMMELLLVPTQGLAKNQWQDLYSKQELQAIQTLATKFEQL